MEYKLSIISMGRDIIIQLIGGFILTAILIGAFSPDDNSGWGVIAILFSFNPYLFRKITNYHISSKHMWITYFVLVVLLLSIFLIN